MLQCWGTFYRGRTSGSVQSICALSVSLPGLSAGRPDKDRDHLHGTDLRRECLSLYPYGTIDLAWNLGLRFAAILIVIAAIAGARGAYVREWWLARTDPLTGALNRQAFFELAQTAIDLRRWRLLIYVDLDGFKKINDGQGHMAGDACLRTFGNTVRRMIHRGDIFARLGGDEFVIFMSVRDQTAAGSAAARLHQAMNNQEWTPALQRGCAYCPTGRIDDRRSGPPY